MSVSCKVFVDGSMSGTDYDFEAVPRQGDKIQIGTVEKDWMLTVESVVFVASGVYGQNPGIQISASSRSLGNA